MEGMGLKFTPGIGRRQLCHSSMFGPMAGSSGTHRIILQVVGKCRNFMCYILWIQLHFSEIELTTDNSKELMWLRIFTVKPGYQLNRTVILEIKPTDDIIILLSKIKD